jgi:hypothetical protein
VIFERPGRSRVSRVFVGYGTSLSRMAAPPPNESIDNDDDDDFSDLPEGGPSLLNKREVTPALRNVLDRMARERAARDAEEDPE